MTSRLDRLFLLLDTGSSPVTRRAAAVQLGEVQKLHPHELHNLLAKVRKYLHSSSWDTRIAASQAVEAIISHVPQWDPPGLPKEEEQGEGGRDVNGEASAPGTRSPSHWMRFEHFDIHQVLKHSGMLLASEGTEFDLDDDLLGKSKEALLHQRRLLNRRLGLEMAEHIGLDTSELFSTDDLDGSGGAGGWHRPPLPPLGPNERPFAQPGAMENIVAPDNNATGLGHVAPAPSPVPCPGLFRGPKRRASIAKDGPTSTKKSRGCGIPIKEEVVCDGNDAAAGGENLWEEQQSGEWPLEAFVEALCQDLFSAAWEVRHGAATALREVVRLHGRGGGRTSATPAAQMEAANQLFLEDLSLRLLCVLALDKFGDFVSDQVVAPVRETCAQTLGHVLNLMMGSNNSTRKCGGDDTAAPVPSPPAGVWGVVRVLLQLLQRPEWEARHGGLLGIKYLLAVRKDLTPVLIPAVFEPVFQGLQDQNDDVSAVAAAALVPVTEDLVRTLPQQIPRVVVTLWDALLELDDLTSSTSSILMLLASLLSHSTAKGTGGGQQAVANNVDGQHSGVPPPPAPPPPPLVEWVPRLWPFLGHNAVAVRRSVLRSLLILTSHQGAPQSLSEWIPPLLPSMLRLLYQRSLLETSSDVLDLIYQVWEQVLQGAPLGPLLTAACPYLSSWLCLAMHPAHLQIDVAALQWLVLPPNLKPDKKTRRPGSVGGALSCTPESTPGVPLVGEVYLAGAESLNENPAERERLVLQCRCYAAKLLGLLSGFVTQPMPGLEVPPVESPVESFARLMLFHLASKSALQRMITAQVMAHWVTLHRAAHVCPESVRERVLCCLGETLYFDELASAFTRLQQDARDFVALMRHFGLPLSPGDFPPSVVLTVDQVIELATTVYQGLVQQVKLRPKIQESLDEKCKGVLKMAVQMQKDQVSLNTMVQAWLATFLVRLGWLPEKLNPVVRPLMESVRREESFLLQEESARSVVQLMSSCVERMPCPNGKIVRNLLSYLCTDPSLPLLVAAGAAAPPANSSSSSSSASSSSSSSSVPTILTLVNMQKSAERAPVRRAGSMSGRRGALQTMHSSESFDDTNGLDDESTQRQNEIQRRGATHVLSLAADHFGATLAERLPSLWQATVEPLLLRGGKGGKKDGNALPSTAGSAPNGSVEGPDAAQNEVQELVTTLLGLEVIGPHLHPDLHPKLEATLGPLCAALDHPSPSVRHLASRCLGMMARVRTGPTMALVVDAVVAKLGASDDDTQRRGAIEAIACVIESLSLGVVPYLVFLVVPVLGRMSDQDEGVRLMATHCFAHLVRLMPLDGASIEEASGGPALSAELQERRTSERHFLEQLMDARHADNYQLSVPINAELRSYQQEGVNWLAFLNRYRLHGILCDDMGLGKTLQSICILASDHHQREMLYKETQRADAKPLPSLVVCPPTLTGHWVYEVEKFVSAKYLRPLHYTGPPVERARLQEKARKHNLVVASYDIVRNDIDFFGNIRWNYCILDEGHIIKNGRTKLARALKQLQANHRLILTGTPIQNQVLDLWSLFDFLMPGFLGTERQFAQRFSRPILQSRDAKSSSREQEAGVLAMESLHRQVLPFLLRRVKDDVLKDLPPKIIQDYYCELSPLQVQLYEDFAKSRAKKTVDDSVATAAAGEDESPNPHATAHVFQALQYLRKVCNHPKLVLQPQHPEYGRIMASLEQGGTPLSDISHAAKLRSLRQLLLDCGIGTASGQPEQESVVHAHRALIFCQLKGMLDIVEKDLLLAHMSSVSYLRLDGSVAPGQRQALVQRFNADPSIDVLLLTTQVGGLGLNLTGADTVIFVEHDWNPMKDLQAMDRAHRIGQKKVVNVYRLITRGTLEEKIMGLQKFKLTIANTVITQENSSLNTMGTDQLLDLFTLGSDRHGKGEPIEAGQSLLGGGASSSARAGMKGVLENLPELWDSSKYDSEYDLGSFLSTLQPK